MGKVLDGFPTWCQLRDPSPEGIADPFASSDCGEECCSIVQFALTGVYTTEGAVREAMPGHEASGVTSDQDLTAYLKKVGVGAELTQLSQGKLQEEVRLGVQLGRAEILLGYWVSMSTLHWVIGIGYGNDHLIYLDPWTGQQLCMHWADAAARFRGAVVRAWARAPKANA